MRKLTKFIAPALFASMALGAAMPAQARPTPGRDNAIGHQISELQRRVNHLDRRDRISDREAAGLRRDVRRLEHQFRVYKRHGLSPKEYRTLQHRIDNIRVRMHIEKRDWNNHRW